MLLKFSCWRPPADDNLDVGIDIVVWYNNGLSDRFLAVVQSRLNHSNRDVARFNLPPEILNLIRTQLLFRLRRGLYTILPEPVSAEVEYELVARSLAVEHGDASCVI